VGLGIQHSSSKRSRTDENDGSDDNNNSSPNWQQWVDGNLSLLCSVGEVVVSAAHVEEISSLIHSEKTSIKVSWGSVELHAVGRILVDVVLIVIVLLCQVSISEASSLAEHAHPLSKLRALEKSCVGAHPAIGGRHGIVEARKLNHVGSVSASLSLSSVSCRVGVASSPLEVNVISLSSVEERRSKVVFGGRVGLHDVSSLAPYIQVEDSLKSRHSTRTRSDVEDVRPVLEGSSELSGVESQSHVLSVLRNGGIISNGGVGSVGGPVNKARVWSVSIGSQIEGGDVVSQSKNTVAIVVPNARDLRSRGKSPVVAGLESIDGVAEMVISRPHSWKASWSWKT